VPTTVRSCGQVENFLESQAPEEKEAAVAQAADGGGGFGCVGLSQVAMNTPGPMRSRGRQSFIICMLRIREVQMEAGLLQLQELQDFLGDGTTRLPRSQVRRQ